MQGQEAPLPGTLVFVLQGVEGSTELLLGTLPEAHQPTVLFTTAAATSSGQALHYRRALTRSLQVNTPRDTLDQWGHEFPTLFVGWTVLRHIPQISQVYRIRQSAAFCTLLLKNASLWASLVAQWLRICLPVQGTQVRALVREDPT